MRVILCVIDAFSFPHIYFALILCGLVRTRLDGILCSTTRTAKDLFFPFISFDFISFPIRISYWPLSHIRLQPSVSVEGNDDAAAAADDDDAEYVCGRLAITHST